ncbi:hypothetical protein [Singulisphaera acidiphila]|nr:hypothetical protein [Singulisphaera acidiphila]
MPTRQEDMAAWYRPAKTPSLKVDPEISPPMYRDRPPLAPATRHRRTSPLLVALVLIIPACSSQEGPELAPVTGKVSYQGKPVTQGMISFQPVTPGGTPAMGSIGSDGTYSLQTADANGARLGDYRVVISARKEPEKEPDTAAPPLKKKPKVESQLPLKYEDIEKSQLTKKVVSGRNTINFDLE